jgi:polyhydroxybutyrate depolymerase
MSRRIASLAFVAVVLAACASDAKERSTAASTTTGSAATVTTLPSTTTSAATASTTAAPTSTTPATTAPPTTAPPTTAAGKACKKESVGGERAVKVHVPPSYSCATAAPLVILLHGYSASGSLQEVYFKVAAEADKRGFLYLNPDGTKDPAGNQFWNATDSCCNFGKSTVDDSAYVSGLITEMSTEYNVDPKRVYVMGHSNGGFMSYRMACEHGDQIAAVATLAGAMWADTSKCPAKTPVSVLQVHGTSDAVISYDGGSIVGNAYPSAKTTTEDWVTINGCAPTPDTSAAPFDLVGNLDGNESTSMSYSGCKNGTNVALWSIEGGSHTPGISTEFTPRIIDFLLAQKKA